MLVGYARVSTLDQSTRMQLDALRKAGVRRLFEDKASGVGLRPQLHQAIASLGPGDLFVVWKMDRIARSLPDLLSLIGKINSVGAEIKSLTEPLDTSNPYGRFTLQVLGAVAELERNIIRERVMAGQASARERGVVMGRPRLLDPHAELSAVEMYVSGVATLAEVSALFGVSETVVRGALLRAGVFPVLRA